MVTSEICDSKSRLAELNRKTGCVCVGNDLIGKGNNIPDKITGDMVIEKINQAEQIVANRDKLREFRGERFERYLKTMNTGRIQGYIGED